jgi:hypothetical protein
MNNAEARGIVVGESAKYRAKGYKDLLPLLGRQDTYEVSGSSGTIYQLEILALWDDKPNGVLRVRAAIDDGGIRAYMPMIEDFLIAPDGRFVGE